MVRVYDPVADAPERSVAVTLKKYVPSRLGVPVSWPSVPRVSPGGSPPAVRANAAAPPEVRANVNAYGSPTRPGGGGVSATAGGGSTVTGRPAVSGGCW